MNSNLAGHETGDSWPLGCSVSSLERSLMRAARNKRFRQTGLHIFADLHLGVAEGGTLPSVRDRG